MHFIKFEKAVALILEKLDGWIDEAIKMLPNLLVAILVVVIGYFLSKLIRNAAKKRIQRMFPTSTLADFAISIFHIIIFGIFVFLALKVLHLDKAITTALGTAGIAGVALAFAFQDIAANFMSGVFMSFRKPFNVGDVIKVKDYTGNVTEIRLRDTTILTFEGQYVTIPNKDTFQNPIVNYTRYGKRRLDIKGGVSQGDDLHKAKKVALEALQGIEGILTNETTFHFDALGESTIDFTVRIWINTAAGGSYLNVLDEAIIKLKAAFDENGISLPFPIRTLDFAMKGGKTLSDMILHIDK